MKKGYGELSWFDIIVLIIMFLFFIVDWIINKEMNISGLIGIGFIYILIMHQNQLSYLKNKVDELLYSNYALENKIKKLEEK